MNIYDPSQLYGLAVRATDEYSRFYAAIAVAYEATRDEGKNLAQSLNNLQETCQAFSDLLLHITCVCSDNLEKLNKTEEQ